MDGEPWYGAAVACILDGVDASGAAAYPINAPFSIQQFTEATMVKDPVCGMTIDEKTAKGQSQYKGQTYYFCAPICKTKFDQDPAKYVKG
jgi:YHS domain-containing protein